MSLTKTLKTNISNIKLKFDNSQDIIVKQFKVAGLNCAILYLKGMTDVLFFWKDVEAQLYIYINGFC